MKKSYNWSIQFNQPRQNLQLPHVSHFGAHEVNTPLYYHDVSVRSDLPHMIFQYTLSGYAYFRSGGKVYKVEPGQGFLCNSGDPDIAYYYPPESDQTYELLYCCMDGNLEVMQDIADHHGPVFELPIDNIAIQQFLQYQVKKQYVKLFSVPPSKTIQMASVLLQELVKCTEDKVSKTRDLSSRIEQYILEHIEQKLLVRELAKIFGYSSGHLSRQFKVERGLSLQQYLNTLRMKHAARLLKNTQLSVKEVAYRMNFDTPAHFTRSFKREFGETPGALR